MVSPLASSASSLRDHLETLPQELYDEIYNLTFNAVRSPGTIIAINSSYRFHALLQVSRATRCSFAKVYYASYTFVGSHRCVIAQWVRILTAEHQSLVERVRYWLEKGAPVARVSSMARYVRFGNRDILGFLYEQEMQDYIASNGKNGVMMRWRNPILEE